MNNPSQIKGTELSKLMRSHFKKSGLSQKAFCELVAIAEGYLSSILSGDKVPGDAVIVRFAHALKLDEAITQQMIEYAADTRKSGRNVKINHIDGIVEVHEELPDSAFNNWVKDARERVWFLDTWVESPQKYKNALQTAAELQATNPQFDIKILLLNPKSETAKQRAKDIWLSEVSEQTKQEVEQFAPSSIRACIGSFKLIRTSIVERLIKTNPTSDKTSMEIKAYDQLPSFSAYICDDRAFMGFFVHGMFSNAVPQLEVHRLVNGTQESKLFKMIEDEFESLWGMSKLIEELDSQIP